MNAQYLATIGRIIIGLFFLAAGASKLVDPAPAAQVARMLEAGVPWPELMFTLAAACETTAGLCFILGLHVRLVSLLLVAFTVFVSILLHAFWTFTGEERTVQMIMFLKNIALAGGLLAFAGFGSGKLSLDHWFGRAD
ncbi:MAG: DoxX family protein [Alphaproteobacteria bacterium]|nr:DoxX family protein [Alphaproteobacteria bacterium]